jgi:glutathione S-transferase
MRCLRADLLGARASSARSLGSRETVNFALAIGLASQTSRCLRFPEFAWRQFYPNLVDLSWRLEQRPSFLASVPRAQIIRDKVA